MFSVEDRAAARDHVLRMAAEDGRVVAGAVVGSFATGAADRWSDLDLTFAIADEVPVGVVLCDWTCQLTAELDGVPLWDLTVGATVYRVFLLPGCLQVDLSFTSASRFRPAGPAFELLFGKAGQPADNPPSPPDHFFGLGVLHALHARKSVERGRYWEAEHSISHIRECALSLLCLQRGLEASHGRGFDDLPAEVLRPFTATLVESVHAHSLLRTLGSAVGLLFDASAEIRPIAGKANDLRRTITETVASRGADEGLQASGG